MRVRFSIFRVGGYRNNYKKFRLYRQNEGLSWYGTPEAALSVRNFNSADRLITIIPLE